MRELSLNVLDIAQNSIAAGASVITRTVEEDAGADRLTLSVEDNGCGMTSEQLERVRDVVDCVITFEELQALFDSRSIDLAALPEEHLNNASYYGRIFARSGGVSTAVGQALKEQGLTDFDYKPIACNGILECKMALLKAKKGVLDANLIEGMACESGCIGGAACLTHGPKDKSEVDNYGKQALEKTMTDAISVYDAAPKPKSAH